MATKSKTHILAVRKTATLEAPIPLCSMPETKNKQTILPLAEWDALDQRLKCGNCRVIIDRERKRNGDVPVG